MNTKKWLQLLIVISMSAVLSPVNFAAPQKRKGRRPAHRTLPTLLTQAVQELIRQTQEASAQSQEEVRRTRQQNEELLKRLAQNSEELAQLRQTVLDFGSQLAALKTTPSKPETEILAPQQAIAEVSTQSTAEIKKLSDEVEILREQSEVHTAQLKEHAQTKVESDSKTRVKLYGTILANTYLNTQDSSLTDVPLFAPAPGSEIKRNNIGASLRQTKIGFLLYGPSLGPSFRGARVSAETEFDFWGGAAADVTGHLRLLTASARLDWDRSAIIVGQRPPLISPRNPASLAAVWLPSFTAAGNLWQWRPQIIAEHRIKINDAAELELQGGLVMPFGENVQGAVIEGGPGYESRFVFRRHLNRDRPLEIGIGSYLHRRTFALGRKINSYAMTSDWAIPLGPQFELSGEAYFGRAINFGEIAGGRNDRLYAINGSLFDPATQVQGIRATGGWAQFTYSVKPNLDFNLAYGQEDPRNREILAGLRTSATRLKNQSASANFIYSWRQNFLISLEYRRFWTDYTAKRQTSGHYNLAIGYTF